MGKNGPDRDLRFLRRRRGSLSLLTWNVWFGLDRPVRRWTELLSIAERLRPDVIALQEVTDPFLAMLRSAPWVRKRYNVSDPRGDDIEGYGTVVLTRVAPDAVRVHPLESEMYRKLVVVEATVDDVPWAFASVHLESLLEYAETRRRQLEHVLGLLEPYEHVALMGDLNFCSSWPDENARIPEAYVDVWPAVRSDEGYTVDSDANEMRKREVGEKRVRFDRVLVRSAAARPVEADLVGTKPIKGERPGLHPSDHFGVFARLRVGDRGG